MEKKKIEELINIANNMRNFSYTPYSHYTVGAALLTKSGKIYTGCNIENAAFSPTICAERVAFAKAVSEGEKDFVAIAVVGDREGEKAKGFFQPCGVCRQVMAEFCDTKEFKIICAKEDEYKVFSLEDILPQSFSKKNMYTF